MPWNGSGIFTRVYNWVQDALAGENIEADRMDGEDDNFRAGIENCLTKDGQNAPIADLPMASRKHTNVGAAVSRNQYLTVAQYQDGWGAYAGDTAGTADAYTALLDPVVTAYVEGMRLWFKAHTNNNDDATININTIGARDLIINGVNVLQDDIVADQMYAILYDGVAFEVLGSQIYRPPVPTFVGAICNAVEGVDDTTFPKTVAAVSTPTPVPFSEIIVDSHSFHGGGSSAVFTIPVGWAGVYQINANVLIKYEGSGSPSNECWGYVRVNDSSTILGAPISVYMGTGITTGNFRSVTGSAAVVLAEGDEVELIIDNQGLLDGYIDWTPDGRGASFSMQWAGVAPTP